MHHSCTELSILRIYKDGISVQHVALKDQFSSKCLYILLQIPSKRTSTELPSRPQLTGTGSCAAQGVP